MVIAISYDVISYIVQAIDNKYLLKTFIKYDKTADNQS